MKHLISGGAVAFALTLTACTDDAPKTEEAPPTVVAPPPRVFGGVERLAFNRRAAELALPLFWSTDKNSNTNLDPDELAVLWGVGRISGQPQDAASWVKDGVFTDRFAAAFDAIAAPADDKGAPADDVKRRETVRAELAQGRPTVVESDFSAASAEDKAIVAHVLKAADTIEIIYAKQQGVFGTEKKIAADDTQSLSMFYRNQGPFCEAPKTEGNPDCSGLAAKPTKVSGIYPAAIQGDAKFCEVLEKREDADTLLSPFVIVVAENGGKSEGKAATDDLIALPYTEAYAPEMQAISADLKAAADAITSPSEGPFKAYLTATSQAFLDNNWQPADEAWSKMNTENSKWYLRIGPDEVYSEPCSRKAGFHVSFARINQDSVTWQKKLDPVKQDMEQALADLAGAPYKAHPVSFHLPDFIDMVLNAGDSRNAHGATIGQSLPNWGPVANEGRGRTVAMTNLYTDKDSEAAWQAQVQSMFCAATMAKVDADPKHGTMSTVLHEAAHNLGPAHEYKVKGKTDDQIFGGPLASTFEELKAQTSALYFADWLVSKGLLDQKSADAAHLRDVTWAFGHISQGMYSAENKPKPYSQLAAIQMGTLYKSGALAWMPEETAANGADKGCFQVDLVKFAPAVDALAKTVLGIKGRGDKPGAEKLKKEFVDDDGAWKDMRATLSERWLRAPKASFVYSIKL